jgi:hypothetical protein
MLPMPDRRSSPLVSMIQRLLGVGLVSAGMVACGGGGGSPTTQVQPPALAQAPTAGSDVPTTTGPTGTSTDGTGSGSSSPSTSAGTTFHVRTDGGDAAQCTGKVNAGYPGSGTAQPCAWISPMVALPSGGTPRIAGGDTLVIHAGQYKVGYGAPAGAENCNENWPYECVMASIPSGPDASHPTRVVGELADVGCASKPQLWGTQRVSHVLGLQGSHHVQVACLELTDHSACAAGHPEAALQCQRSTPYPKTDSRYPFGDWADTGLYAADASDVQLTDLDIHGLARDGIQAGRLNNWRLTRVRIAANGLAGWDGDLGDSTRGSSNSGSIKMSFVTVEWNGCVETYGTSPLAPTGCFGQSASGYGDGLGTAKTGGHWVIEDSVFKHNVSDGLDLLYMDGTGTVTLNRVWSEGNAGNQIKVSGTASVSNSVVVGQCDFFKGQAFVTQAPGGVDHCRAAGDAVAVGAVNPLDVIKLANNTITGNGNVSVLAAGPAGSKLLMTNNVLIGKPSYFSGTLADVYTETAITIVDSHNLKQTLRNAKCTPAMACLDVASAGLVNDSFAAFDPHLLSTSPARDSGTGATGLGVPVADFFGTARPQGTSVDRGAVEFK